MKIFYLPGELNSATQRIITGIIGLYTFPNELCQDICHQRKYGHIYASCIAVI